LSRWGDLSGAAPLPQSSLHNALGHVEKVGNLSDLAIYRIAQIYDAFAEIWGICLSLQLIFGDWVTHGKNIERFRHITSHKSDRGSIMLVGFFRAAARVLGDGTGSGTQRVPVGNLQVFLQVNLPVPAGSRRLKSRTGGGISSCHKKHVNP